MLSLIDAAHASCTAHIHFYLESLTIRLKIPFTHVVGECCYCCCLTMIVLIKQSIDYENDYYEYNLWFVYFANALLL